MPQAGVYSAALNSWSSVSSFRNCSLSQNPVGLSSELSQLFFAGVEYRNWVAAIPGLWYFAF